MLNLTSSKRFDALDTWCLWKILRISCTRHIIINETVGELTSCTAVSEVVRSQRLRFFGHTPVPSHSRCTPTPRPSQLTGGDRLDVQEQPGSKQLMKTSSPRTLEFTLHGGRTKIATFGAKSSARQRSDRSSPKEEEVEKRWT